MGRGHVLRCSQRLHRVVGHRQVRMHDRLDLQVAWKRLFGNHGTGHLRHGWKRLLLPGLLDGVLQWCLQRECLLHECVRRRSYAKQWLWYAELPDGGERLSSLVDAYWVVRGTVGL